MTLDPVETSIAPPYASPAALKNPVPVELPPMAWLPFKTLFVMVNVANSGPVLVVEEDKEIAPPNPYPPSFPLLPPIGLIIRNRAAGNTQRSLVTDRAPVTPAAFKESGSAHGGVARHRAVMIVAVPPN